MAQNKTLWDKFVDVLTMVLMFPIIFPGFVLVGAYDGAVQGFKLMRHWLRLPYRDKTE